jgi:hypothetical protein
MYIHIFGPKKNHARRAACVIVSSSACNLVQSASPKAPDKRACACCQFVRARESFRRPAGVRPKWRSRRSSPSVLRIHSCFSKSFSIRVNDVLSRARSSPSFPWVIPSARSRAVRRVNCVTRSLEERNSSSYNWVTARAARRSVEQAQGSGGKDALNGECFLRDFVTILNMYIHLLSSCQEEMTKPGVFVPTEVRDNLRKEGTFCMIRRHTLENKVQGEGLRGKRKYHSMA